MPVPALITDLSTTPGSNSPPGSESPAVIDDYLRTYAAFIAQLRDGAGFTQVRSNTLGTTAVPAFSFVGDTNTGAWSPTADTYAISTGGLEALRVTASQQLLIGSASSITTRFASTSITPRVQQASTSGTSSAFGQFTYAAAVSSAPITFHSKSRGVTVGAHTIVQSGDLLGSYSAAGSDGVQFCEAGRVKWEVDAAPGVDSMPGRFVVMTTPAASITPSEALRIDSGQNVLLTGAGGLGYGAGSGGFVNQTGLKSDSVTLNNATGYVRTVNASLAAGTAASFTMSNSVAGVEDIVVCSVRGTGLGSLASYSVRAGVVAAGNIAFTLKNESALPLSELVFISFAIIRGSST